jgi:LysR family glycine cleavage system transcriptional activator
VARRLPPLNPLRAFEAAARHLSMSRAAKELSVTHGAISHQVRSLEQSLKVQLFAREGGRLTLSPQGSALLPAITGAFGSIGEAVALLTAPSTEGTLVISCLPSIMTFWLVPRLGRFADRHPGVRLKLISSNDKRLVLSPDVDVWVTYGLASWPDRDTELWLQASLFPVCSPALINSKALRSVEDLRNHTLLHADDGREWGNWLNAARAPELACGARHVMSDAHLATLAAIHGHGVALCDTLTGTDLLAEGRLIIPLDLTIPAPEAFYIVYRRELKRIPIVRAFIEWLLTETHYHVTNPHVGAAVDVQSKNATMRRRKGARRVRKR